MNSSSDVIVVGAGASGSALAARLSEDPSRRVLVLEAGRAPTSLDGFGRTLLDASRVPGASPHATDVWRFPARLSPGRDYTVVRGRILGGSTTVNGGYFIRPRTDDLALWASAGGTAWDHHNSLPLLRRMERDLDYGASAVHGDRGPIPVSRAGCDDPWSAAFRAAALGRGHLEDADKNDQNVEGVGPVPMNVTDGVRWNAAAAYLLPNLSRPNLDVRGNSQVLRVRIERGRATGVEVSRGGRYEFLAADETILCAGAFGSAHLLMLSGVGPTRALREAGIEVASDAPVGVSFSDHPQVIVEARLRRELPSGLGWLSNALHLPASATPGGGGAEILQGSTPLAVLAELTEDREGLALPIFVSVQQPKSRGALRLVPRAPGDAPAIDYHYLQSAEDRADLREGVRETTALLESDPMAAIDVVPANPELADMDDHTLDEWILSHLGTAVHACGTAPMGSSRDGHSVVDGSGRVHGVSGLRVADTSILPGVPRRGPAASAALVGEVVAELMR